MLKIDSVTIPTPTSLGVSIMDISKAERNAAGTMIVDRIATKRKLELSYAVLSQANLSAILTAISPVFFEVEYIDPQDNATKIGTFYTGDRKAGAMDFINGIMRWKDITFNLIER